MTAQLALIDDERGRGPSDTTVWRVLGELAGRIGADGFPGGVSRTPLAGRSPSRDPLSQRPCGAGLGLSEDAFVLLLRAGAGCVAGCTVGMRVRRSPSWRS